MPANRGKQARYLVLEKDLVEWVESQRKYGYTSRTPMYFKLYAMKLSKTPTYEVDHSFKFSTGWCTNFMKRNSSKSYRIP